MCAMVDSSLDLAANKYTDQILDYLCYGFRPLQEWKVKNFLFQSFNYFIQFVHLTENLARYCILVQKIAYSNKDSNSLTLIML